MTMESLGTILRRIAARGTWRVTDADTDGYHGSLTKPQTKTAVDHCDVCRGTGWLSSPAPVAHADFGKVLSCQCRESAADLTRRIEALERYSNLGALRQCTFANADPNGPGGDATNRPAYKSAFHAAVDYADNPHGWITFVGPSGGGKTYLAAAIVNQRIANGKAPLFITSTDLLDYLRGGFDDDSELGFIDLLEQVRQVELLVVDDLPARPSSPWGQERLSQLLAWRHSQRLPTIVTLRGDPNHVDDFLRTRLESADGFGRLCQLGRMGRVQGRTVGVIPPNMRQRMTFDAFNPEGKGGLAEHEKRSLQSAKAYVQRWAQDPGGWLSLHGPYGVGKTHLAVAAAAQREDQGDEVFFATVADLLDYLRAAFAPDSPITHDDLLDRIRTADVLVLDDMGAERSTPFAEDKLFQIVGYRYEERLPTFITTSHQIESIAATRPRIASRLQDPLVVTEWPIEAPDYRQGGRR
jgi:DNA replication protein DnaC